MIWLHPEELKFQGKKYFCCVNIDRRLKMELFCTSLLFLAILKLNVSSLGVPFNSTNKKCQSSVTFVWTILCQPWFYLLFVLSSANGTPFMFYLFHVKHVSVTRHCGICNHNKRFIFVKCLVCVLPQNAKIYLKHVRKFMLYFSLKDFCLKPVVCL